jgi:hypothetical protein
MHPPHACNSVEGAKRVQNDEACQEKLVEASDTFSHAWLSWFCGTGCAVGDARAHCRHCRHAGTHRHRGCVVYRSKKTFPGRRRQVSFARVCCAVCSFLVSSHLPPSSHDHCPPWQLFAAPTFDSVMQQRRLAWWQRATIVLTVGALV